jgi:hypothetical protein
MWRADEQEPEALENPAFPATVRGFACLQT